LKKDIEFTQLDFMLAFDHFLKYFDTYESDIPKLIEILPLFIARAIYDEVLPCLYVKYSEMFAQT